MALPQWASALTTRVCRDAGVPRPTFRVSHQRTVYSGGSTRLHRTFGGITMRLGTDRKDQRLVLLHELAHWITLQQHTRTFWEKAWDLYRRYAKADLSYALQREASYKVTAIRVARSKRIPGARALHEQRKATLRKRRQPLRIVRQWTDEHGFHIQYGGPDA